MLPSTEMVTENVEEEILLVIINIFVIQSRAGGFHFLQDSWQSKLGKILNASIVIRNGKIVLKRGQNRPFFLYNLTSENCWNPL